MKRVLALILGLTMMFTLVACGSASSGETGGNGTTLGNQSTSDPSTSDPSTPETTQTTTQTPVDLSNWGVEDKITTKDGTNIDRYLIRVPKYKGSQYYYSKISEQPDDTVVLLSGQYGSMPAVDEMAEIFSSYKNYTLEAMGDMYGARSKNFEMSIDSSEAVKVGDRDMYKHTGKITFTFDGTEREHQYVAYATKLKNSGNGAYWMVYDISADQSNGALIAEHALNMSKTFKEEK